MCDIQLSLPPHGYIWSVLPLCTLDLQTLQGFLLLQPHHIIQLAMKVLLARSLAEFPQSVSLQSSQHITSLEREKYRAREQQWVFL